MFQCSIGKKLEAFLRKFCVGFILSAQLFVERLSTYVLNVSKRGRENIFEVSDIFPASIYFLIMSFETEM